MPRQSADDVLNSLKRGRRQSADEVLASIKPQSSEAIPGDILRVDLSNPRGETYPNRMLKGAAIGLRMGGKGLKGLFGDLSPADVAEIDRMKGYVDQAGWPAVVGRTIEEIPQYAAMQGLGPASMAGRAVTSGLTGMLLSPEDRVTNAATSAIGSVVGEAATGGLGARIAHPFGRAQDYVRELWDQGVRPTWAQALGDGVKALEEKMTSVPLVGSAINRAHLRTKETFNTASQRGIIDELNRGVLPNQPGNNVVPYGTNVLKQPFTHYPNMTAGAEGLEKVRRAVGNIYQDLATHSSGEVTPELAQRLQNISAMAGQISPEAQNIFNANLQDVVFSRLKPGQRIPGDTFKQIDSDLQSLVDKLANPNKSSVDNLLAKAFMQVKQEFMDMMDSQNPGYADIHRNADMAWHKLALLGKASTSSVGDDMATPAQLLQAIRAIDKSNWKQQFATDNMPWSDWARNNLELMGNRFPDSGTAARSAVNDAFGMGAGAMLSHAPEAAALYLGSKAAWSPLVQDFLVEQSLRQPGAARSGLAQFLSNQRPVGSVTGAAFSNSR